MTTPIATDSTRIAADGLRNWARHAFSAVGMPPEDAALLATSLVQTSLWGVDTHGVARLPHYLERLTRGSIKPQPAPRIERTGPCTAQLHADQGHGIVTAHRANRVAMDLAR